VNYVDLLILGLVGLGFWSGYRRGAVMQLFSWGGFILGLVAGAFAATEIMRAVNPSPSAQAILVLVILFGTAFIVEALVVFAGAHVAAKVTAASAKSIDRALGSLVAAMLALLSSWLLSAPARQSPQFSKAIRASAILRGMYSVLSQPPNIVAAVGGFLDRTGFPEVFSRLNPSLAPGVDAPPASLASNKAILAARALTYKIESEGCGGRVDGTGFPAQARTVITAAHVVAGTAHTRVIESNGTEFPAVVVYLDPGRDIAVLRVATLPSRILPVDPDPAKRNTDGAAIGYPGGGPEKVSPARVRTRTRALGRDIYSRRTVQRDIYVLRAEVHQGNSGGPFVDTHGSVRGMIFAASKEKADESYALAETEIERALHNAASRSRAVDTGECAI